MINLRSFQFDVVLLVRIERQIRVLPASFQLLAKTLQPPLSRASCSFALNVSSDFAAKNMCSFCKTPSHSAHSRVLLVRIERVFGFCCKEHVFFLQNSFALRSLALPTSNLEKNGITWTCSSVFFIHLPLV